MCVRLFVLVLSKEVEEEEKKKGRMRETGAIDSQFFFFLSPLEFDARLDRASLGARRIRRDAICEGQRWVWGAAGQVLLASISRRGLDLCILCVCVCVSPSRLDRTSRQSSAWLDQRLHSPFRTLQVGAMQSPNPRLDLLQEQFLIVIQEMTEKKVTDPRKKKATPTRMSRGEKAAFSQLLGESIRVILDITVTDHPPCTSWETMIVESRADVSQSGDMGEEATGERRRFPGVWAHIYVRRIPSLVHARPESASSSSFVLSFVSALSPCSHMDLRMLYVLGPSVPQDLANFTRKWYLDGGGFGAVKSAIETHGASKSQQALTYLSKMSGHQGDSNSQRYLEKLEGVLDDCGLHFGHLALMRYRVIHKIWRIVNRRVLSSYNRETQPPAVKSSFPASPASPSLKNKSCGKASPDAKRAMTSAMVPSTPPPPPPQRPRLLSSYPATQPLQSAAAITGRPDFRGCYCPDDTSNTRLAVSGRENKRKDKARKERRAPGSSKIFTTRPSPLELNLDLHVPIALIALFPSPGQPAWTSAVRETRPLPPHGIFRKLR